MTDVDPWVEHRGLLFSVAYDLLGSIADAEDVVQETWLRWSHADRADVLNPRAYLVRIATTQALNRMRTNQARRETYVGPWLPEPLVESDPGSSPDPAQLVTDPADIVTEQAARAQDVSLAMLVVLETLSPAERAVFVLREVFGMSHDEVAAALDRTPASVRQLAHRAREHVQARRPRFEADENVQRRVTEQFLAACSGGDLAVLMDLLAPDVTLLSDGGGLVSAARRPIAGPDKVARFLLGIAEGAFDLDLRFARINGAIGLVGFVGGQPRTVAQLDIADGRIQGVYLVANPDKLVRVHP